MNHGSSSLDLLRASRKSLKSGKQNPKQGYKSRGLAKGAFIHRIFPKLPPLKMSDALIDELANAMHQKPAPEKNPNIPAAYTYFGQFVSHDLTAVPTGFSIPRDKAGPQSPYLDLDSVYGKQGLDMESFYEKKSAYLLLGQNRQGEADLPRNPEGVALISDPRNDVSIMISQMHLCFLKFHNACVTHLGNAGIKPEVKSEAKRLVRWHYQWVVVHDYLKRLVGEEILYKKISRPGSKTAKLTLTIVPSGLQTQLPLEFSGAAYRMGHSMIRSRYYLNEIPNSRNPRTGRAEAKAIQIFDFDQRGIDLRGGRVLPDYFSLQWNRFLRVGQEPQYAQRIDTCMTAPMARIPDDAGKALSMAKQNLRRGRDFDLPSGQRIAKELGIAPLDGLSKKQETPLWYYVLQEAELLHEGKQLGPLGGNLIAEVMLAALKSDPASYFSVNPSWNPESEALIPLRGKDLELQDIVAFAGMPMTKEEVEQQVSNPVTL